MNDVLPAAQIGCLALLWIAKFRGRCASTTGMKSCAYRWSNTPSCFNRSIGEHTDIVVEKEMYTFKDTAAATA